MKDRFCSWEEAVLWLREQPDKQELVRACYYDDPLLDSAERFYNSTEWVEVQRLLAGIEPRRALDIGAGRGIASYALARDGWRVTALEPDTSEVVGAGAIEQLAAKNSECEIHVVSDHGEKLPFEGNSFELVYGRAVLHHADDVHAFCCEIARVLRPGGLFLLTREHVISRTADLNIFLDSHPLHALYGGENAFLLKEYLEAIKNGGLHVQRVLAPYDSDINMFPSSETKLAGKIAGRLKVPVPKWLVRNPVVIMLLNQLDQTPGRLFSFVGNKP